MADIHVGDAGEAIRIVDMLTAALNSKPSEYGRSSMHTQHIPEENRVRVTLWGGIRFMAVMMASIAALTEQGKE